jgi:ATP-dependent exoDNAse (exonuclease V) beta subunit
MIRRLDDTSLCNHHIITSSNHLITPRTSYGISIHNYLSTLTSFPQNKEEIDWAVQNMDEIYKDALARFFNKILNDPSLSPYFAPNVKVLNETSILFPDGNLLRPDRVVFMEDRVVVIDYKTGDANASHKEQIEQYCEAIRNMGYGEVEGRILYM